MKQQNNDATGSMSALEITAMKIYLLLREYRGTEKSGWDLHLDFINAEKSIKSLKLIQLQIMDINRYRRRQATLAGARVD